MPSTYAHYVFGEKVYQGYPPALRDQIAPYKQLFSIGLHGPDILFYYNALSSNPVNRLGNVMHTKPGWKFFSQAAEQLEQSEGSALYAPELAYICGFLCHFALDAACHGYVEKKIHVSGVTHTEIEMQFDRSLLVRDGKNPQRQRLTDHIVPSRENAAVIAPFFPSVTADDVWRALRSMVAYHDLLLAPNPIKRYLIFAVLWLARKYKEMHSLIISPQPNPLCEDSNAGLYKRMEEAVGVCLELTDNFLAFLAGEQQPSPLFEQTFSFGPDWQDIVL